MQAPDVPTTNWASFPVSTSTTPNTSPYQSLASSDDSHPTRNRKQWRAKDKSVGPSSVLGKGKEVRRDKKNHAKKNGTQRQASSPVATNGGQGGATTAPPPGQAPATGSGSQVVSPPATAIVVSQGASGTAVASVQLSGAGGGVQTAGQPTGSAGAIPTNGVSSTAAAVQLPQAGTTVTPPAAVPANAGTVAVVPASTPDAPAPSSVVPKPPPPPESHTPEELLRHAIGARRDFGFSEPDVLPGALSWRGWFAVWGLFTVQSWILLFPLLCYLYHAYSDEESLWGVPYFPYDIIGVVAILPSVWGGAVVLAGVCLAVRHCAPKPATVIHNYTLFGVRSLFRHSDARADVAAIGCMQHGDPLYIAATYDRHTADPWYWKTKQPVEKVVEKSQLVEKRVARMRSLVVSAELLSQLLHLRIVNRTTLPDVAYSAIMRAASTNQTVNLNRYTALGFNDVMQDTVDLAYGIWRSRVEERRHLPFQ